MTIALVIWFVASVTMIYYAVQMFALVYRYRDKLSPEITALAFAIAWVFFLGSVAFVVWTMLRITNPS